MAIIYIHALSNGHCDCEPDCRTFKPRFMCYMCFHWYIDAHRFYKTNCPSKRLIITLDLEVIAYGSVCVRGEPGLPWSHADTRTNVLIWA